MRILCYTGKNVERDVLHMNVYLIRHGLARSNLPNPDSCPYDPRFEPVERHDHSLTPRGEQQADLTGRRLAHVRFDAALVSPFHRTLSTCAGILRHQEKHLTMEVVPALVECDSAHFRMMPSELVSLVWDDVRQIMPYDLPDDTPETMWARARRVVEYVKDRFGKGDNVLIVSHGGFLCHYLIAAFLGLDAEQRAGMILAAENCAITKLRVFEGITVVAAIDETGHLGEFVSREPFDL